MKIIRPYLIYFLLLPSIILLNYCSENKKPTDDIVSSESKILFFGERIDGPANIRDSINGKIIIEFYDNVLIECEEINNNWFQVGTFIEMKSEDIIDGIIPKGRILKNEDNIEIGEVKSNVESWIIGEEEGSYYGFIAGYTFKDNIKPESIVENQLMKILNSKKEPRLKDFKEFIHQFDLTKGGLTVEGYENLNQYYTLGSFITDPSPIDRLRLMFEKEDLISIIHERKIETKIYNSYTLTRGLEIMIIKDFEEIEMKNFIEKNKESYYGVD